MAGALNTMHVPKAHAVSASKTAAPSAAVSRRSRSVASKVCSSTASFRRVIAQKAHSNRCKQTHLLRVFMSAETRTAKEAKFTPVLKLSELEKGTRTMVETENGKSILFFWYRNEVYGIESRSPAEGAFSDGFYKARFTQDGCIECPSTKSTFNLKTGEVQEWYPDNPVLRAITPKDTVRPLEVFPVKVDAEAIYVDPYNSNLATDDEGVAAPTTKGGAASSAERNNVFGIEPPMYLTTGEEIDMEEDTFGDTEMDPATLAISTVAVAIVAVAGTATCLYYENLIALAALWIVGFGGTAYFILNTGKSE